MKQFYDGSVGAQFLALERQTMSKQSSSPDIVKLEQALHEASVYGIGATSDVNQRVILDAAKHLRASLQPATKPEGCDPCGYPECGCQGRPAIGGDAVAGDVQAATPQVRLEARPADDSHEWTEIYPAQLQWMAKQGHQVRAIELPDAAQPSEQQRIDDAKRITSAVLNTMTNGGDNLAIYEAVWGSLSSTPSADPMTRPHRDTQ